MMPRAISCCSIARAPAAGTTVLLRMLFLIETGPLLPRRCCDQMYYDEELGRKANKINDRSKVADTCCQESGFKCCMRFSFVCP